jgi:hypothetical protein
MYISLQVLSQVFQLQQQRFIAWCENFRSDDPRISESRMYNDRLLAKASVEIPLGLFLFLLSSTYIVVTINLSFTGFLWLDL